MITNPKYKGFYCSGKTMSLDYRDGKRLRLPAGEWYVRKDESIPAIVTEELWDMANRMYESRGEKAKANGQACQSRYPFSGKIICGEHGATYHRHVYHSKAGDAEVWNCRLYRQKGKTDGCDSPTIYSHELNEILDTICAAIVADKDSIIQGLMDIYAETGVKDNSKETARLKTELNRLEARKESLLDLFTDGTITREEFAVRNNAANADIERVNNDIQGYEAEARTARIEKNNLIKIRKALENELNSGTVRRDAAVMMLDNVVVHKIDGDKTRLRLEITLNIGKNYIAEVNKNRIISLHEIGISQAQVSRLEKNALKNMKKYIS